MLKVKENLTSEVRNAKEKGKLNEPKIETTITILYEDLDQLPELKQTDI